MSYTRSADLVHKAEQSRPTRLTKSLAPFVEFQEKLAEASRVKLLSYRPWARALSEANEHITVRPEEIADAQGAYRQVAEHLFAQLRWPRHSVSILPQGSASTQTLIRSPNGGERFDIDAVCEVDISRIAASDPMSFFQSVGDALEELKAQAKKRCWYIPFTNEPFYLDVTPSVPMNNIEKETLASMAPRYSPAQQYRSTALAVVDTPTGKWKTSNPAGMTKWVDDTAKRPLIIDELIKGFAEDGVRVGVTPVPDQVVEITDTLRVAIRLFKRHRDMCVKRNIIAADTKPISIVIVTLLTTCYEGLADLNRSFEHPVQVLDELAALMPHLVLNIDGQYRVDNPTVDGENFAEKWTQENNARYRSFIEWCRTLSADLKTILTLTDPLAISKQVRNVFGIPAPTSGGGGLPDLQAPMPRATPPSRGLA